MLTQWITYAGWGVLALALLTILVGVIYEKMGRSRATREFPPPGKLVDIGGRHIQIDCRGSGSPTVVFESGLDILGSLSWSKVHDEIAKTTRACAYSRAGMLWSDPSADSQYGKTVAEDLHAALQRVGERGPFVLVGHSLGGPYIMTYTKHFGADVAGLVLVDASHPDQERRLDTVAKVTKSKLSVLRDKIGVLFNRTGIVRAVAARYEKLPNQPEAVVRTMQAYAATSFGPMLKESAASTQTFAEAGSFRDLGQRPLVVLSASAPLSEQMRTDLNWSEKQLQQYQAVWQQMQAEMATWSTQSQHWQLADAGHYIQFDRPDAVIAAVQSVVAAVRAQSH